MGDARQFCEEGAYYIKVMIVWIFQTTECNRPYIYHVCYRCRSIKEYFMYMCRDC